MSTEEQTTLDSNIFKIFNSSKTKSESVDSNMIKIDQYSDTYNMNNYKRGTALIFNHYQFDGKATETREGTEKDVEALQQTFKLLQFDVEVCQDYYYSQIYDKIDQGKLVCVN